MGFLDRLRAVLTTSDTEKQPTDAGAVTEGGAGAVATPPQQRTPAQERTHTVVRGDTLPAIAERHGVDPQVLADLNGLDNPDLIYPGQVFRLPGS